MTNIAVAGAFMSGLGVVLATVLAVANRRLHVEEDPRIDEVEEMLPKANCGACGIAGCRPFAEAVVAGKTSPGKCTVNSPEMIEAIANYLGVEAGHVEKQVARLACAGGSHVAYTRARYQGLQTCRAAAVVAGGGKGCAWGCIGLGDCASVCDFNAIQMNKYGLPVVSADRCTACGDCVEVCPKGLFSLQPVSHQLWVACKNQDLADEGEAHCELVCTACGRCAADAPEGLIQIRNNLAVIDYSKNALASRVAIERCPTGAIVWFDREKGAVKGADARRVTRKEPLQRIEPLPRV
ncbi:MAG: RnfABCDGE type electron transport complex subunit B [Thiohalomonadaceae bacterium]